MAAILDSADEAVSASQNVLLAMVVPEPQSPDTNNQKVKVGIQKGPLPPLPLYCHVQKELLSP